MAAGEARRKRMIGPGVARFIKVTSQFTSHFSATEGPHTWSPPVRYIGQIERQRVSFHISHTSAFEGVGAEEWVYGDVAQGGECLVAAFQDVIHLQRLPSTWSKHPQQCMQY